MKLLLFLSFQFFVFTITAQNVVVLGVEHSAQLVNTNHQPAILRAFMDKVNPEGICIERSPREYLKNDFYEFTFEQQYCIIPYAKDNSIPLYPIDWIPEDEDLELAFGVADLAVPRFTRNPSGFWGFTVFSDSTSFNKDFYFADEENYYENNKEWYANHSKKVSNDFARRLFLYRTFLQAKRIESVCRKYSKNDTILVVIGALHKNDIEVNLASKGYTIIQPSSYGKIALKEKEESFKINDAYAITTFNLLGMQSKIDVINKELVDYAINKLDKDRPGLELEFFKVKYDVLRNKIDSKIAIKSYLKLLTNISKDSKFTWTGVKHNYRIDSYFDPFGNLTLWQRIHLELAREYLKINNTAAYQKQKELLFKEFKGFKLGMLSAYWGEHIHTM
ncbi:hypothetical protein [uncultured Polaribacter sp.]|uniref:hypothetical protein n=1 Tax=uncultured Polaribacter sp. TaxID=174711 RepID=UPI002607B031|nr:hypothetical protein [uncultured Polaribacter sp.]